MTQLRLFDRQPVEHFKANFGAIAIDDDDADLFEADADLVLVIKVSVDGASHKRLASGEWQRINALAIKAMGVATGEKRTELVEYFGFEDQLTFLVTAAQGLQAQAQAASSTSSSSSPAETDVSTDVETGEVLGPSASPASQVGQVPPPKDPALSSFLNEATG